MKITVETQDEKRGLFDRFASGELRWTTCECPPKKPATMIFNVWPARLTQTEFFDGTQTDCVDVRR